MLSLGQQVEQSWQNGPQHGGPEAQCLAHAPDQSFLPRPSTHLPDPPSAGTGGAEHSGSAGWLPASQSGAAGAGVGAAAACTTVGPPGVRLSQVPHPLQPR